MLIQFRNFIFFESFCRELYIVVASSWRGLFILDEAWSECVGSEMAFEMGTQNELQALSDSQASSHEQSAAVGRRRWACPGSGQRYLPVAWNLTSVERSFAFKRILPSVSLLSYREQISP